MTRRLGYLVFLGPCLAILPGPARGVVDLPDHFVYQQLTSGPFTGDPTGLAILPDGRALITEQTTGVIRVVRVGSSTADFIFTVPNVSSSHTERGLLGIEVDPDWPARPYLYLHYTHTDGTIKVVMYTVSGALTDPQSNALTLSNRYVLLGDIPDATGLHNGGSLRFGLDGTLFVSIGDDGPACNAQDLTILAGKILRIDVSSMPGSGSGPPPKASITPADNPFPGPNENERLVWSWGLRNPYRFAIDPVTGDLFIGDVGDQLMDEVSISDFSSGGGENFGWPQWEGTAPSTCCGTCGAGNLFTPPAYPFFHEDFEPIAVVSGPVIRTDSQLSASFPSTYDGDYFLFEFFGGTLTRLTDSLGTWVVAPMEPGQHDSFSWGFGLGGVTDARLGADGALYFTSMETGMGVSLGRGFHRIAVAPGVVDAAATAAADRPLRVFPNPMTVRGGATIDYSWASSGAALLRIYDSGGRLVRTLRDEGVAPGTRSVAWDGRTSAGAPATPGVYYVLVRLPGQDERRAKLTVIR